MSATVPCQPSCCPTVINTQVPGAQGDNGTDGLSGTNAYAITSAPFVIPAVSSAVAVSVNDTSWMVVGEVLVAGVGQFGGSGGPAHFSVAYITSSQGVNLTFLGYAGDASPTTTIGTNSTISPSGNQAALVAPTSAVGSGTAYVMTATRALLALGTTTPSITIPSAGTWLITARARLNYNGATFAAVKAVTIALHRTNNTPIELSNSGAILPIQIVTTYTEDAGTVVITYYYTTTNANDIIQVWGSVSTIPSAGTLDCDNAEIYALKLF